MSAALSRSTDLYETCFRSYSLYGKETGHMHTPVLLNTSDTFLECLNNLNDIVIGLLNLRGGERILDIGCGRGALAVKLAKEFKVRVHGIASSNSEIEIARSVAVEEAVEDHCRFDVGDMNSLMDGQRWNVDAATTIESEAYFESIAHACKTLDDVLRQDGIWISARVSLSDEAYSPIKAKMYSKKLEKGWATAPIKTTSAFEEEAGLYFSLEEKIDLSKNILRYWDKFGPLPLNFIALLKARFLYKAYGESRVIWDIPTVFYHRIAFIYHVMGLNEGSFEYHVYKLRKR